MTLIRIRAASTNMHTYIRLASSPQNKKCTFHFMKYVHHEIDSNCPVRQNVTVYERLVDYNYCVASTDTHGL